MNSRGLKSVRLAYLLWLASIFGWLGLHRIYLGKRKTAILWICTLGVLGIGSLADAIMLKWLVRRHNRLRRLKELRHKLVLTQQKKQRAIENLQYGEAAVCRDEEALLLKNIDRLKALLASNAA